MTARVQRKERDTLSKNDRYEGVKAEAMENCVILYGGRKKPMTESLMCFGWECPDTWNDILSDLSFRLEGLNVTYYPKYRTRIEAVQVKEKFGSLRFYYDMHTDPPKALTLLSRLFMTLHGVMKKIDYKYKNVVDRERHETFSVEEVTDEDYAAHADGKNGCSNTFYEEAGGRKYKTTRLTSYAISHLEPTRMVLAHAVMNALQKIALAVDFSKYWPVTKKQHVVSRYMSELADEYISEAEDKTERICSVCGAETGYDKDHPTCATRGWATYICKRCAEKAGQDYWIDGKIYNSGKLKENKAKA